MKCLMNINRTQIPNDIMMTYIKLYKSIGNNPYHHRTLESDNAVMVRQTVTNDVVSIAKILNLQVSEGRIKSLIYKGVLPKNKSETLILNLYETFTKIHKETHTFDLHTNEVFDMINFVYHNVVNEKKIQFKKFEKNNKKVSLLSGNVVSKRDTLDKLIETYQEVIKEERFETSFIIINFYIDFLKSEIFVDKNEEIGLLLLYILLITNDFEVFEYVSFFDLLQQNFTEFTQVKLESSFNWEEGYAQTLSLHRFILKISNVAYDIINSLIRDYEFDSNLNKSNNVENTINKLDEIFTKDDIRNIHPYISDSTINRTLKRLRDEDKIRPLGKGRSAKWIKLEKGPEKKMNYEQVGFKL